MSRSLSQGLLHPAVEGGDLPGLFLPHNRHPRGDLVGVTSLAHDDGKAQPTAAGAGVAPPTPPSPLPACTGGTQWVVTGWGWGLSTGAVLGGGEAMPGSHPAQPGRPPRTRHCSHHPQDRGSLERVQGALGGWRVALALDGRREAWRCKAPQAEQRCGAAGSRLCPGHPLPPLTAAPPPAHPPPPPRGPTWTTGRPRPRPCGPRPGLAASGADGAGTGCLGPLPPGRPTGQRRPSPRVSPSGASVRRTPRTCRPRTATAAGGAGRATWVSAPLTLSERPGLALPRAGGSDPRALGPPRCRSRKFGMARALPLQAAGRMGLWRG